jgi:hypothetical protein
VHLLTTNIFHPKLYDVKFIFSENFHFKLHICGETLKCAIVTFCDAHEKKNALEVLHMPHDVHSCVAEKSEKTNLFGFNQLRHQTCCRIFIHIGHKNEHKSFKRFLTAYFHYFSVSLHATFGVAHILSAYTFEY